MRAGRLRHKAQIITLRHDLSHHCHGSIWCGITVKEGASPPMPSGLRTGARVDVRARYTDKLAQGVYLMSGQRILHVTSVRDVTGKRAELMLTCDEFAGQPAQLRRGSLAPIHCRAHLQHSAPFYDSFGQITDYRIRAEVLIIEVGRPQAGDLITVAGQSYTVTQYAGGSDDGAVRALWLEAVE